MKPIKLIQPVAAERTKESYGYWTHPDYFLPANGNEFGIPGEFEAWTKAQAVEVFTLALESDLNAEAVQLAYEAGDGDVSDWEPTPPTGEGWFIGSIHDTEDGPYCIWLRRTTEKADIRTSARWDEEMSNKGRYVYHYCAVSEGNTASVSGIAQLTFRIVSQDDLDKLKGIVSDQDFTAKAITSLSFLGCEFEGATS